MLDMLGLLVICSIIVAFGAYVAGPSGFGFTFVMCAWFFLYTLSGRMHRSKKETYQWEVKVGKRKKEWIREDGSYDWEKYPYHIGGMLEGKEQAEYLTWLFKQPPEVYERITGEKKTWK